MKFKILSHACLLIESENSSIIIDPWLIGSCYWRSWWNFPQAEFEVKELERVDAVFISHVHWDHWHGPTLKKFFKGKPIYIPDEPGLRSAEDLASIGFTDVNRVSHGHTVKIGNISVTLYQFGLFLNDAAIVVEAGGVTLLNANDAKISGWPLMNLIKRHGAFDFAFRSHSSANPRICFIREDLNNYYDDDREHYFRSFSAFMDCVQPLYAIPFASNHCHLHDDVYRLNEYISNPLQLRDFVREVHKPLNWALNVMLPGSRWDSKNGFKLSDESCFDDLKLSLDNYRVKVHEKLERFRNQENSVKVTSAHYTRFVDMLGSSPISLSGILRLSIFWPDGRGETVQIDLRKLDIQSVDYIEHSESGLPLIIMPAIVFRDAVLKNMFHHGAISKRIRFLACTAADMKRLRRVFSVLELCELGFYPLSLLYIMRLFRAYILRWRELIVYVHAFWLLKFHKKPFYLVEEIVLKNSR